MGWRNPSPPYKLNLQPKLAKPSNERLGQSLVNYRISTHNSIFNIANAVLSAEHEKSFNYRLRPTRQAIDDWAAKHIQELTTIEAEVASELGVPHEEIFDALDNLYNPRRIVLSYIQPSFHDFSLKFYNEKVIELYIHKVALKISEHSRTAQNQFVTSNQYEAVILGNIGAYRNKDNSLLKYSFEIPSLHTQRGFISTQDLLTNMVPRDLDKDLWMIFTSLQLGD